MKTFLGSLAVAVTFAAGVALSQPLPPATTPWSRTFLKSTTTNEAHLAIGLAPTNTVAISVTNTYFITNSLGVTNLSSGMTATNLTLSDSIGNPLLTIADFEMTIQRALVGDLLITNLIAETLSITNLTLQTTAVNVASTNVTISLGVTNILTENTDTNFILVPTAGLSLVTGYYHFAFVTNTDSFVWTNAENDCCIVNDVTQSSPIGAEQGCYWYVITNFSKYINTTIGPYYSGFETLGSEWSGVGGAPQPTPVFAPVYTPGFTINSRVLPYTGVTTNVVTGSRTLYITNGIIMKVE